MGLSNFDIFPKLSEDYSRRTTSSGIITVSCISIMSFLFISQSYTFMFAPLKQRLRVDESPLPTVAGGYLDFDKLPKLKIFFDITLHSMPCAFVNFGVIDDSKAENADSFANVKLKRYDANGNPLKKQTPEIPTKSGCGSCYGIKSGCCNTCKDVRNAYKEKGKVPPPLSTIEQCRLQAIEYHTIKDESCRLSGNIIVPPDNGAFFISPADSYGERLKYIKDYLSMGLTLDDFNLTHTINSFYIGDNKLLKQKSSIDGLTKVQKVHSRLKAMYFIRTVREAIDVGFNVYRTSITHYERYREGVSGKFPGLYFHYDVAPVIVEYKREVSVLHFLVDLMAILGGIFAIGTLIDHLTTSSVYVKQPQAFN